MPVGNYVLGNVGPDEPFGGGEPGATATIADPDTTGQVLEFRVVPAVAVDPTTPPRTWSCLPRTPLSAAIRTRKLALMEMMSEFHDGPAEAMLGVVGPDGQPSHRMWMDDVTENPAVGDTEVSRSSQLHRGRPPDARPRGGVRGREPASAGDER